ncbi:NAD(P)-dependent oxidoreductase [Humidisolicoccus flavus]|uniref:NAD(P)-dependent oxidoreductase n=1 Tax=Humidisolicoccus flavus TaxID=3111414 RepID=UPI0032434B65
MNTPNAVLIVGDSYIPAAVFSAALERHGIAAEAKTMTIVDSPEWSVDGLREYEGDPRELSEFIDGHEVLVVHGAPVSRDVLIANPSIKLICCARGGPVNIDIAAANELGVAVTTTPGKNAHAVADLTIGFLITSMRNVLPALRSVDEAIAEGREINESAFEGARWFGAELRGRTLGLIGFGNVARLVADRAIALGMQVFAYDPFVPKETTTAVTLLDSLEELYAQSEVLSVHARATKENQGLVGAAAFASLREGAVFINTARESLVDEHALLAALRSGHLGAAAMDVCEPDGPWRELVGLGNVIVTPHIAGASHETLARGAEMIAEEITRWQSGDELRWRV